MLLLNAGHDDYARRFEDYPPLASAYLARQLTDEGTPFTFLDAARNQQHHRLHTDPWIHDERPVYHYGMNDEQLRAALTERFGLALQKLKGVVLTTGLSWAWPAIAAACSVVRSLDEHLPVTVAGPYPTLVPGDAHRRLIATGLADRLHTMPPGVHVHPDPHTAGEATTWTAAVLVTISHASLWSTGLDQPIYAPQDEDNALFLLTRRPADDVAAECIQRVAAGYRRFVWWDLDTLADDGEYLSSIVRAVRESPAVRGLTTSWKVRWFNTTAMAPETVNRRGAAALRLAQVPHVRLRLDRYHRDGHEALEACRLAADNLMAERFAPSGIDAMIETAFPGDSFARTAGLVRDCLATGISPRLQAWAPIPGSADWETLSEGQRLGGGLSKWLPGCYRNPEFTTAQYKQLHTLAYHARELLHAGIDPSVLASSVEGVDGSKYIRHRS